MSVASFVTMSEVSYNMITLIFPGGTRYEISTCCRYLVTQATAAVTIIVESAAVNTRVATHCGTFPAAIFTAIALVAG